MLDVVFRFIQQFIFDGTKFVNWITDTFGWLNYSALTLFTFTGLTAFIGVAVVKWLVS